MILSIVCKADAQCLVLSTTTKEFYSYYGYSLLPSLSRLVACLGSHAMYLTFETNHGLTHLLIYRVVDSMHGEPI